MVHAVLALPALILTLQTHADPVEVREEIRRRVEQLREGSSITVSGVVVEPDEVLPSLYEARAFEPLWKDPAAAAALPPALEALRAHGLDPLRYDIEALRRTAPATDAAGAAEADLLRTHALVHAAGDLRFGRVDPGDLYSGWELARPRGSPNPADIEAIVAGTDLGAGLEALAPSHFAYRGLVAALAELRAIREAGGWPRIAAGPVLARDSASARVAILRRRLTAGGDLPPVAVTDPNTFDATVEAAVRRFQHRHGLNDDGIVGPATLAELNVSVDERIDRVRVNLERGRWILRDLADTFVAVNIAGQRAYYVHAGQVAWETRVIVGREYTRTPIFSDTMRYIVLNPTWTVPRSINGEILAAMRRDGNYLQRQNIRILNAAGRTVDRTSVDPTTYTGRAFPYTFRQDPGPANALGRIKFMFPNAHNVYLHDTPSRSLFEREVRTFSHGCIRVQDPLALAELLLDDPEQWSRSAIEAAIASGETRTVNLDRPIPTLLLYWTASADMHGELHFYRDVYDRDARLLRALDGPG